MKATNYIRGCCDFQTFLEGFMAAARRHDIPLGCVNRLRARQHWRSGLTGNEALLMQRRELLRGSEYLMVAS